MKRFEFDVNKYTKPDLEEMLSLSEPYTNQELFNKIKIVETEGLKKNPEMKNEFLEFLSDVTAKLKKYDDILIEKREINENKINPISLKSLSKYLHFDSKFRKNYYSTSATDVIFTLPYIINNAIELSLHEIDIPDSYYQVSSLLGNNHFVILCQKGAEDQGGADTSANYFTFDVTIPDGNWSTDTLVYYLNNTVFTTDWDAAIAAQHDSETFQVDNYYYARPTLTSDAVSGNQRLVASYSDYSNKITIGVNNIQTSDISGYDLADISYVEFAGIELHFNVNPDTPADKTTGEFEDTYSNLSVREKLGFMLGFKSAKYKGATAYVGESPVNLISSSYFYLVIDDFIGNHIESNIIAYTDSYNSKDIFAKIGKNNMTPISTTLKTDDTQLNNPLFLVSRKYMGPVTIKKLRLSIIDEFGRNIDLNNLDWSCTLKFTYLYD
tara:strand:+ start:6694 stop:8010 length:1317 start_codon:yes stop_codon:yes gene_type:complete